MSPAQNPRPKLPALAFSIAVACLVNAPGIAAESAVETAAHIAKRLDPSDFRSRIELRNRLQEPQSGGLRNTLFPRFEYAVSKQLSLRVEAPVMVFDGDRPGLAAQGGMGDLVARVSFRALRTKRVALVVGGEFNFDTASDRLLGTGKHSGGPIAFLAIDSPALHSTFFPLVQHVQSFGGDPRRHEVDYTINRVFVLTRWPDRFYTGTEASVYIDHSRGNQTGATLELEVGRFLNSHIAVWARPGFGNWGDQVPQVYNWDLEVGVRYLFD